MKIRKIAVASLLLFFGWQLYAQEAPLWAKNAINYFYKLGARNDSIQKHHKYYGDIVYTRLDQNIALIVFKDEDDKKISEFCTKVLYGYHFVYKRVVISSKSIVSPDFCNKAKQLYPLLEEPK